MFSMTPIMGRLTLRQKFTSFRTSSKETCEKEEKKKKEIREKETRKKKQKRIFGRMERRTGKERTGGRGIHQLTDVGNFVMKIKCLPKLARQLS